MANKLNYERAARLIAEAALFGDSRVVDKEGVTRQTLRNLRRRLDVDPRLQQMVVVAKRVLTERWAEHLMPAILKSIEFVDAAVTAALADPATLKNPDMLHSVNGSIKLLAEVHMGERMLNARLAGAYRHTPEAAGSLVAHEEGAEEGEPH